MIPEDSSSTVSKTEPPGRNRSGSWSADPSNPNDFYFTTTAAFTEHSRLWRLRFNDVDNPTAGGIVQLVLEGPASGSGGPRMMDNITVTDRGGGAPIG